ncbi:MAG: MCE family protein, partial [Enterobacterales bacterium]|nr:MCE family protein [Enterobacterales bacterium]
MNDKQPQPHVKAKKNVELSLSPIWFLPIIAVVISAWLLVKLTLESKVPITIQMTTAQGIVAGKTQVKFRGISAGNVTRIEVAESLGHVIVHAEIEPSLTEFLTTETKFWVVRAQISLAGVSGLDTVLSGDYIAFDPGKSGTSKRSFVALNSAPPIGEDDPGMRIMLTAENLGSISEGSQLYYRQIPIGEVRFYELSTDTRSVQISALINPEYVNLVNSSTVFWNSGGVRLSGSLSGFEVKTESLSAILAGGISLFTPDMQASAVASNQRFTLHEDYDDAGVGVPIKVAFTSGYDLQSGITKVKFHGIDVGHLDSINVIPDDDSGVIANVVIDPGAEPLLVEDTQFWLVKPNLSLRNLSNLETLISGNYITLKTGDSQISQRDFNALDKPPPPDFRDPGLHVFLKAKTMGSINIDTPVLYKGVEVGRVANIFIDDLTEGVGFHLHIRPEHGNLINSSSRFWDESGLDVSAGLGGLRIRSTSLMNIVRGGIAFETDDKEATIIEDGHEFSLLDSPLASESPLNVVIELPSGESLESGITPVKYKGMSIGVFKHFEYQHKDDRIFGHFELNNKYADLITSNTVFWLVTPRLDASK